MPMAHFGVSRSGIICVCDSDFPAGLEMTGHVGDMTVPHAPFLLSRILFLEPQGSTSCSLGLGEGRWTAGRAPGGAGAACAPFPASLSSSTSGFGTCHT